MKTINLVMGLILLVLGAFYLLLPHSVHMSSGIGFGLSHTVHMTIGAILLVIGIVVLVVGRK